MNEITPPERLRLLTVGGASEEEFAEAVRIGLGKDPKSLPCRFLYDSEGSRLFEEICDLPEYYLTRAEEEILRDCADELSERAGPNCEVVELGSGSAVKTRLILEAFLDDREKMLYHPIDISRTALLESSARLLADHPTLEIVAVHGEYRAGLRELHDRGGGPQLVLWLGSSIGNFGRNEACAFLRGLVASMTPEDRLLLGVDLRKDRDELESAYDDASGVTARFSKNLLARINRELGGRFDLDAFRHRAAWLDTEGHIAIDLVSEREQTVPIVDLGLELKFRKEEPIRIEESHKYSLADIADLAHAAGLEKERQWLDAERRFSLSLLAPQNGASAPNS